LKGCASRITRRGWARRRFRRGGISACTLSATSRGSTASAASRGRGASARDYQRLKAGLDRLLSTTVATSIRQAAERRRHRFSWINEWKERADANGRALGVELILPDWFYAGVLQDALVLNIDRAYFSLTGGLELSTSRICTRSPAASRRSSTSPTTSATSFAASRFPAIALRSNARPRAPSASLSSHRPFKPSPIDLPAEGSRRHRRDTRAGDNL
jgi:hypothetical protein